MVHFRVRGERRLVSQLFCLFWRLNNRIRGCPLVGISRNWQNPRWLPSIILKIHFSMVWPILSCNISFSWFVGSRISNFISIWQFDLVMTFKSNMAANLKLKVGQFSSLYLVTRNRLKWKLSLCWVEWHILQESPADARDMRDSAVIPRWPSAAVLAFR